MNMRTYLLVHLIPARGRAHHEHVGVSAAASLLQHQHHEVPALVGVARHIEPAGRAGRAAGGVSQQRIGCLAILNSFLRGLREKLQRSLPCTSPTQQ